VNSHQRRLRRRAFRKEYPEQWKLLWRVAFGEFQSVYWLAMGDVTDMMEWLLYRGYIQRWYDIKVMVSSFELTDIGKRYL